MNKSITAFVLTLLLLALPLGAAAEETVPASGLRNLPISTVDQFLTFAENCRLDSYSENLRVILQADLDLTDVPFGGIPIFCGSFDGQGHTIRGISLTCDGSNLGLFRYLTRDAQVENLHLEGSITPKGSESTVGGIVGNNAGTIVGCSFSGTVSGGDYVGGIVGSNAVTGIVEDCQMDGSLSGKHFVGGIAGSNSGVLRDCTNNALVNTTANQNSVELSDITMDSLRSSEAVNTVTDIGGIAGTNGGVIRSCENTGDVGYLRMGYNIGGIAGSQMGYITGCVNRGLVQGRKEVGGIAGQMEPVSLIEYTEDTLQILQKQMNAMSALTNRASSHVHSGSEETTWYLSGLQSSIGEANEAIRAILPELIDGSLDSDSILAAQGVLSSSLQNMQENVSGMASSVRGTVGTLASDLRAISGQLSAMQQTINNASDYLGGSITDISDRDTPDTVAGKVADCINLGAVTADRNAGGIAGAMTLENDLDLEEDLQFIGDQSLNFSSELRAVILGCRNTGTVTANKQNVGGIVGWMPIGLVKDCLNTGTLDGESADYVGGIAGRSNGFIRFCYAKCRITGADYVGGIAGSADTVSSCRSLVSLGGTERLGAMIGFAEPSQLTISQEESEEAPQPAICGNLYSVVAKDFGAIDGISYQGCAQPVALEEFLALEDIPEEMMAYTVRFRFPDGHETLIQLRPGSPLMAEDIPDIPPMEGYTGCWDGLTSLAVDFDTTFEVRYVPLISVLASSADEGNAPEVLVEGAFQPDAVVSVEPASGSPALSSGQSLLTCVRLTLPESKEDCLVHLLIPDGTDSAHLTVLGQTADGAWEVLSHTLDGSYLVFPAGHGTNLFAVLQTQSSLPLWVLGLLGAVVAALVLLLRKHLPHHKKST